MMRRWFPLLVVAAVFSSCEKTGSVVPNSGLAGAINPDNALPCTCTYGNQRHLCETGRNSFMNQVLVKQSRNSYYFNMDAEFV